MSSALRVQRLLPHISTSLSLTLFNLPFSFGGVISPMQTARPLDYKLQIVTVLRFEASKVNSQASIYDSVFLFFFFFFQKRTQFLKYPHLFCLLTKIESKTQNPPQSLVLTSTLHVFLHILGIHSLSGTVSPHFGNLN